MDALDAMDALGLILANTFRSKDMTEMRFSAEERACAEIERLHNKRKEFQITSRTMAARQLRQKYENNDSIEANLKEREKKGEFANKPEDHYQISTKRASEEVEERKWLITERLHHF